MIPIRALIAAAGVIAPVLAWAAPGALGGACMNDMKTLCGAVEQGGGRIRDCMREHRASLSDACKIAIADRMLEHGRGQQRTTGTGTAATRPVPESQD
jgi:hypothetical protein